jgi:hypothetical protein
VRFDNAPPATLENLPELVGFPARPCAAWDFGLLSSARTVADMRRLE